MTAKTGKKRGRPLKDVDDKLSYDVRVAVRQRDGAALDSMAETVGISPSAYIRMVLVEHIRSKQNHTAI